MYQCFQAPSCYLSPLLRCFSLLLDAPKTLWTASSVPAALRCMLSPERCIADQGDQNDLRCQSIFSTPLPLRTNDITYRPLSALSTCQHNARPALQHRVQPCACPLLMHEMHIMACSYPIRPSGASVVSHRSRASPPASHPPKARPSDRAARSRRPQLVTDELRALESSTQRDPLAHRAHPNFQRMTSPIATSELSASACAYPAGRQAERGGGGAR